MRMQRILVPIIAAGMVALFIGSCSDKGTEAPEDRVTASSMSVDIVPATSRTITIMGGRPPYGIVAPLPDPIVASASLVDSSVSPATLIISAPSSATITDNTTVTVGDADELAEGGGSLEKGAHGENSVTIFVNIVAVGNVSFSDDVQPIFDQKCEGRGCHPGGGAPFSLNRFVSWFNLWNVEATNQTCGAQYRVVPDEPDSSLLYLMVSGRQGGSCPRMPFNPFMAEDTLTAAEQETIFDWIDQGANNN